MPPLPLERHVLLQAASEPPRGWVPHSGPLPHDGQDGTPAKGPTVEEIKQGKTTHGGEKPPPSPEEETQSGFRTGNS